MKIKPKVFTGSRSAEITYEKDFEKMCIAITQNLHLQTGGMTVFQFYNAHEHLLSESNKQKKRMARIKKH